MTRTDYILLSTVLRRAYQSDCHRDHKVGIRVAAQAIADKISERHTGFDARQFMFDITRQVS